MKYYFSRKLSLICIALVVSLSGYGQLIIQEDFTNYDGTAVTVPMGWTFSENSNYTGVSSSGKSGPNSYRFHLDSTVLVTPSFSNADSLYFWIKGSGIDPASSFVIYYTNDSITWHSIARIDAISNSGEKWGYALPSTAKHVKFEFFKVGGNLAFDDVQILNSTVPSPPPPPAETAIANGKIKIYFNQAVDTTVSTGVAAINLGASMLDTLVAYINRAKYSIDIAEYNFMSSASTDRLAKAINNAYSRGVKIRWIYNDNNGTSNSGLNKIHPSIQTLGRTGSNGLMHNKILIIDAKSPNQSDAFVITGSINWGWFHFTDDFNNIVIFQDVLIADAFTKEFNQMWGSTGLQPNLTYSRFGSNKNIILLDHTFDVGGVPIDVYFSPGEPTNDNIEAALNSADKDLYFALFSFTRSDIATTIKSKKENGVFTAGIMDQSSLPYDAYSILDTILGENLQIYTGTHVYHNKFGIVDPSDPTSDPLVITGSYNWSTAAETVNDENTVIIHSAVVANMYLQAFYAHFNSFGGQLASTNESSLTAFSVKAFPNPFTSKSTLQLTINQREKLTITAYNLISKKTVIIQPKKWFEPGEHSFTFSPTHSGVYLIVVSNGNSIYNYKLIKVDQ